MTWEIFLQLYINVKWSFSILVERYWDGKLLVTALVFQDLLEKYVYGFGSNWRE